MKLHRFTASNNQKAISMIHDTLGPDALVYSTRSVPNGIEMIAGLPSQYDEHYENAEPCFDFQPDKRPDFELIEKLNLQLNTLTEKMQHISSFVDKKLNDDFHPAYNEQEMKRNHLHYQLNLLGLRGKFSQQFCNHYLSSRDASAPVTLSEIERDLRNYILTSDMEIIDGRNICALIGPTGIGKTTTILKLAKRYISRHGSDKLGIITTDYHDISGRNLLLHYQNLFNIDVEFAENAEELSMVINSMRNKNLILIDTHGVSQRDSQNVTKLVNLMESQGTKISSLLVLPCNVQDQILDEIARTFKTSNLSGCILTKQDECISIAPALSVSMNYGLKIQYICNGQDINKDIERANVEKILFQVMTGGFVKTPSNDDQLAINYANIPAN